MGTVPLSPNKIHAGTAADDDREKRTDRYSQRGKGIVQKNGVFGDRATLTVEESDRKLVVGNPKDVMAASKARDDIIENTRRRSL